MMVPRAVVYVSGLLVWVGFLYLQRQAQTEACVINQSECIGAGGFTMLITLGVVLWAIIGGALVVKQYFQKRAVKS